MNDLFCRKKDGKKNRTAALMLGAVLLHGFLPDAGDLRHGHGARL